MRTKRCLSALLALILLFSAVNFVSVEVDAAPEVSGENLFRYGDFNVINSFDHFWNNGAYNGGKVTYSAHGGVDGTGCAVAIGYGNGGATGMFYNENHGDGSTRVYLQKGQTYVFSADIYREEGVTANTFIGTENGMGCSNAVATKNGEWERVSTTFTATATGGADFRFVTEGLGGGQKVYLDNISIVCTSSEVIPKFSASNLFRNADFNTSASFDDFWNHGGYGGGVVTWSENGGVDGSGCAVATGYGNGGATGLFYNLFHGDGSWRVQLMAGESYTFSADIYREAGVTANAFIGTENGMGCSNAAATKNGEWERVSTTFTATATGGADFRFVTEGLGNGQKVYLDNISLVRNNAYDVNVDYSKLGDNLIAYGDYNVYNNKARTRNDWGGIYSYSNISGVDGSGAYIITGDARSSGSSGNAALWNSWDILSLVPNKIYTLSADVYRENGVHSSVTLCMRNGSDGPVTIDSEPATKNGQWETISMTFKATFGSAYATIRVNDLAEGEKVIIDNFSLKEVGADASSVSEETYGSTIIPKCSFNVYNNGAWSRNDWNGGAFTYSNNKGINGSGAYVATGSAHDNNDVNKNAGLWHNNTPITLESGEIYKYSVKVYRPTGVDAKIYGTVRHTNDAVIAETEASEKNGEWETLTTYFVAPSEPVYLTVRANRLAAGANIIVDELELCKLGGEINNPTEETLGDNLIPYSDYNVYNNGAWPRDDWNGGYFRYSNTSGIDGSGAWVASGKGQGAYDQNASLHHSNTAMSLEKGKTYKFTVDIFRPEGVTSNVSGMVRSSNDTPIAQTEISTENGKWETLSTYFTATESPVFFTVFVNALPEGQQIIADNMTLREVGATASEAEEDVTFGNNIIPYGEYDVYNNGAWPRDDWNGGWFTYSHSGGVNDSGAWMATGSSYSNSDGAKNAALYHSNNPIKLTAGTMYMLTADIYRPEGVDGAVTAEVRNTSDRIIASTDATTRNGKWEKVHTYFIATDEEIFFDVRANRLAEGENIYIDNLCVREAGKTATETEPVTAVGDNLLENGEFNTANGAFWWPRDDWNGGYFRYSSMKGIDSTGAWIATGKGTGKPDENAGLYYTDKTIALKEGEIYELTASVYREKGVSAPITLAVRYEDDSVFAESNKTTQNGVWEEIKVRFVAGKEGVRITVRANMLKDGQQIRIDNIALRQVGGIATEAEALEWGGNEIINGSFRIGRLVQWRPRDDWDGGRFDFAKDFGRTEKGGSMVAVGIGKGTANQNAGLYYTKKLMNLEPGETYKFSGWFYREEGVNAPSTLVVRNADDSVMAESDSVSSNGKWEYTEIQFVATEDPVMLTVRINALAQDQKVYVDDIALQKLGGNPDIDMDNWVYTGDNMPIICLAAVCALTAGVAVYVSVKKKRKSC